MTLHCVSMIFNNENDYSFIVFDDKFDIDIKFTLAHNRLIDCDVNSHDLSLSIDNEITICDAIITHDDVDHVHEYTFNVDHEFYANVLFDDDLQIVDCSCYFDI